MNKGEIIIYHVEICVDDETMWLSLSQMSYLFGRDKSVISRCLKNIFTEGVLKEEVTIANFATVQAEGDRVVERMIDHYSLDAILSIGYRVNSKQGVKFRKYTSAILRDCLINAYSMSKDKMIECKIKELQSAIDLISATLLISSSSITAVGEGFVEIIQAYSKTRDLLIKYDDHSLRCKRYKHM